MPDAEALRLPDGCRVRLIDLDYGVGALISVDEEGFANIYLNARLSREKQRQALRHELAHFARDDWFRDADIREIEREAGAEAALPIAESALPIAESALPIAKSAMSEAEGPRPAAIRGDLAAFDPASLRPSGPGTFRPEGEARARAERDLRSLGEALDEAVRRFDVVQARPWLPANLLREAFEGLNTGDIAFIQKGVPAVLRFCCDRRGEPARAHGAIYYAPNGAMDGAVAVLTARHVGRAFRVSVDLRMRGGALEPRAIDREIDGGLPERLYGE